MGPFFGGHSDTEDFSGGFLNQSVVGWINNFTLEAILAILLLFIEAWLLNYIINRNRLEKNLTSIPGMIYILLMSAHPSFLGLSPIIVGNLFVLLGLGALFKIYKKPLAAIFIFNAGLFFGIASLIYRPYLILLVVGFLGVLILNTLSLKRAFQFFIGFLLSYYLSYVLFLNLGAGESFLNDWWWLKIFNPFPFETEGYVILAVILILVLFTLLSYNSYMIKKSIQVQQKIDLFFWIMLFAFPAIFLIENLRIEMLTILAIPLAVLLHMNVVRSKNSFVPEFLHLLVLLGILGYQYSVHLF